MSSNNLKSCLPFIPTNAQKLDVSLTGIRFLKALILKQVSIHMKDCLSSS